VVTTFEFDDDGFLTERRPLLEAGIRNANERLFVRAEQINRDCHKLLFSVSAHNEDGREMLVAVAFIRALEHYQAAVLLLQTGLVAPAKVASRATLEAIFTARAIAATEEALKAFITADFIQRRKLLRKAQQHEHTNLAELRVRAASLVEKLDADIQKHEANQKHEAKSLTTEQLAQLAGMHDWYTTAYAMLSMATHTVVRELECYLLIDADDRIQSLEYAPSLGEVPWLLLTVAHCILLGGDAITKTFGVPFDAKAEHVKFIEAEFASLNPASPGPRPA
jgi:hypothetical protein